MPDDALTLFLCGDVMLGRGVDQILPHPGNPTLHERMVRDARNYVDLAVSVNGQIPQPVDWSWPWGDALQLLEEHLRHCVADAALKGGDEIDAKVDEATKAIARMMRT